MTVDWAEATEKCLDDRHRGVEEGKWASILDANLEHNCGATHCLHCAPAGRLQHDRFLEKYKTMGHLEKMIEELAAITPRAGPHWDKGWASRQAESRRDKLSQMRRHKREWIAAYKELKA